MNQNRNPSFDEPSATPISSKIAPTEKKNFWNKPLFQSAPNLSIYQNYSVKKYLFEIAPSRLVPQESYFQACFFKKEIFKILLKIAFSKNTFSKLIPQKYIFKTAHLKSAFSKNTFSKFLPQKIHFQNCTFKKSILIPVIYSSSESSEGLSISSIICLITCCFFSMFLHSLKSTYK